jgi:chaperonin GroES
MKFRPLHDRVVVKRIDADEKSAGGIIIPDTAKEKPSQGEVTAVGPGGRDEAGKLIPIDLKVGAACCSANGRALRSRSMASSS